MKKNGNSVAFFMVLIVIVVVLIAACGESEEKQEGSAGTVQSDSSYSSGIDESSSSSTTTTTETTTTTTTTTTVATADNTLSVKLEGTVEKVPATRYVSERFGYSILYPSERMTQKNSDGYDYYIWDYGTDVYLAIYKSSKSADTMAQEIRSEMADYFETVSKDSMKIDGTSATLYYCSDSYGGSYDEDVCLNYCFIPKGSGCLVVEMQMTTEMLEGVGAYMNAMLESMDIN